MIFEIDGEPLAAVVTNNAVNGPADVDVLQRAYLRWDTGSSRGPRHGCEIC